MERTELAIKGMSCGHCVASVNRALGQLEGVEVQEVKVGSATVAYDPQKISAERVAQAIEQEGYLAEIAAHR